MHFVSNNDYRMQSKSVITVWTSIRWNVYFYEDTTGHYLLNMIQLSISVAAWHLCYLCFFNKKELWRVRFETGQVNSLDWTLNRVNGGREIIYIQLFWTNIAPCLPVKIAPMAETQLKEKCLVQTGGEGRSQTAFFCAGSRGCVSQTELVQSETSSGSIIKSEVCSVWALRLVVISFSLADSQSGAEWIVCE